MKAEDRDNFQLPRQSVQPAWTEVWHLWHVIVPRRTITGRLAAGKVWRRHDGRHFIYKQFVEYDHVDR